MANNPKDQSLESLAILSSIRAAMELRKRKNYGGITHGCSKWPEYRVWKIMIQRCENPNLEKYQIYGKRGIRVCARWRKSFVNFILDVGRRPSGNHSIDRINNDKGYQPGNVRWATRTVQARNCRKARRITFGGETRCIIEWAEKLHVDYRALQMRFGRGWSAERALTQKFRKSPCMESKT